MSQRNFFLHSWNFGNLIFRPKWCLRPQTVYWTFQNDWDTCLVTFWVEYDQIYHLARKNFKNFWSWKKLWAKWKWCLCSQLKISTNEPFKLRQTIFTHFHLVELVISNILSSYWVKSDEKWKSYERFTIFFLN